MSTTILLSIEGNYLVSLSHFRLVYYTDFSLNVNRKFISFICRSKHLIWRIFEGFLTSCNFSFSISFSSHLISCFSCYSFIMASLYTFEPESQQKFGNLLFLELGFNHSSFRGWYPGLRPPSPLLKFILLLSNLIDNN